MVYAGIVDITPSPFKHFQGCHESTQVYSVRMGVAPARVRVRLVICLGLDFPGLKVCEQG